MQWAHCGAHLYPQCAIFDCWILTLDFQTTAPCSLLCPCFLVCRWGPSHLYHLCHHPWRKVSFLKMHFPLCLSMSFLGRDIKATFWSTNRFSRKNYPFFKVSFGWVSKYQIHFRETFSEWDLRTWLLCFFQSVIGIIGAMLMTKVNSQSHIVPALMIQQRRMEKLELWNLACLVTSEKIYMKRLQWKRILILSSVSSHIFTIHAQAVCWVTPAKTMVIRSLQIIVAYAIQVIQLFHHFVLCWS